MRIAALLLLTACSHVPVEAPVATVPPGGFPNPPPTGQSPAGPPSEFERFAFATSAGGTRRQLRVREAVSQTSSGVRPECRVVFLPGLGDDAASFGRHAFESELSSRGIEADVLFLDERLGPDATGVERLRTHVLGPSIDAGYSKHWLVGVSLGGGTAIRAAATHPELVHGVFALAPVFASPSVVKAAHRAGGLHAYEHPDPNDEMGRVFRWLRERERPDGSSLPIHLAWGAEDPLGSISELVATAVDNPIVGGGGHEWEVWRALWTSFLDHGYLQRACGAPRPGRNQ